MGKEGMRFMDHLGDIREWEHSQGYILTLANAAAGGDSAEGEC